MTDINRLTNYAPESQDNYFDIRTERLDPIVSSAYRYQFRLDPAAFLDKNSMLLFKVNSADGDNVSKRLNCFNGALGAVKNIELQIGDNTVQRIEDVNKWATLNKLFALPVAVQEKVMSHYLKSQLKYDVAKAGGDKRSDLTGVIQPDNARSGLDWGDSDTNANAAVNSLPMHTSAASNQLVGIPLGVLCPMLAKDDFPLFLFQEYKVHLTINFEHDAAQYVNDVRNVTYSADPDTTDNMQAAQAAATISDVHLLVDYLIFPVRVIDGIKAQTQKKGGYTFNFINVETIDKTIAQTTANKSQQVDLRLNVVNQEVHYIQMVKQLPSSQYDKVCLGQRSDSVSIEEYQFNVNGVDVYTEGFIISPLESYNNTNYVLGRDLAVPKPLCVADTNTQASLLSPPDFGLLGKYKPICLDLRNGEPIIRGGGRVIGEYPIRHIYNRKPHEGASTSVLTPACPMGQPETGNLDVQYFVGVTRLVNVLAMQSGGNSVVVSDL